MKIYHNPKCSKSNVALDWIRKKGIEAEVINYLKDTPTREELIGVLKLLHLSASDVVRKNEALFLEQYKDQTFTEDQWLDILIEHPILIERPIAIHNGKAVIARPVEKLLELLPTQND